MLKNADRDCFPNIRILLAIGCISLIGSTEAERAASGARRLKTPYRATMGYKHESDLKLFLDLHKGRLFNEKIIAMKRSPWPFFKSWKKVS